MLSISLSSAPHNLKSFNSIFLSKTTHFPRSPMKSQDSSKDEIDFVLNCAKRVLSIFQNFKFHNDLCEKCNRFVNQAINILEEMKILSNNKKIKLIESSEYNHFNNLIFDIEFYLRKYDQRTAVQSEVKESIQEFALNLESCINTFQQVFETEKSKKTGGWNPSIISKVKTIGRLIVMSKHPESIREETYEDENDVNNNNNNFVEENPNRLIIQQELITSTGIHRGSNNIRKGIFINEEVAEKYIGNISKKSNEFSKFQSEISYIKNISRDCNNILSVSGYFERNACLWVVEEWAEYNLLDYLRKNLNLNWRVKLAIARGIANALNYIHNLNLLHYNVKIDNILLNHNLEPKLHNFGKDNDDNCIYLKPFQPSNWIAPEVKRKEEYNSASEVYSFGVILWEIATQDCQSEEEFIERRYVDDAPVNYLTLMGRALNKEPHNRPTMQEMFDSLYQLESSYNVRYQKIPLERNLTNTSSITSNSSEYSPILNDGK
jgi:serine/threonine protein kinase